MIFKVQQALNDNKVLVYNKDRSLYYQGNVPKDVKSLIGNKLKAYYEAKIKGEEIVLDYEVSKQDW